MHGRWNKKPTPVAWRGYGVALDISALHASETGITMGHLLGLYYGVAQQSYLFWWMSGQDLEPMTKVYIALAGMAIPQVFTLIMSLGTGETLSQAMDGGSSMDDFLYKLRTHHMVKGFAKGTLKSCCWITGGYNLVEAMIPWFWGAYLAIKAHKPY